MLRKDHSQKSIAEAISVNPSNVSRELRRTGMNRASYCCVAAQRNADSHEWKGV
jgi:IS30 family transposase